ncbi:M48 family metalloprotease [Actinophytocola sp.]|uniref:M48 family metalloprotease n=1 Tax=Actinophytocola sp. TaxID=1872138 RepID=UPI002ED136AB
MFDHFVWSVVVVPVLVLAAGHLLVDRLRPDLAARAFAWATAIAGIAAGVNLFSFALKALAEIPAVARMGGWSHETVAADTAHVPWVSWLSLLWCVAAGIAVTVAWRARRRAIRTSEQLAETLPDGPRVVVVPSEAVDAFSLPGPSGRIVVTTAMRDTLHTDRLDAVIAHEQCHLDQRHHDLLWLTRLGKTIHPLLTPMLRHVQYLVERAADEAAADAVGNRRNVAAAVGEAALRANRVTAPAGTLHLGARPGEMPRRVNALLADQVGRRLLVWIPALVAVSTVVWTGECVYDLQELLVFAMR